MYTAWALNQTGLTTRGNDAHTLCWQVRKLSQHITGHTMTILAEDHCQADAKGQLINWDLDNTNQVAKVAPPEQAERQEEHSSNDSHLQPNCDSSTAVRHCTGSGVESVASFFLKADAHDRSLF